MILRTVMLPVSQAANPAVIVKTIAAVIPHFTISFSFDSVGLFSSAGHRFRRRRRPAARVVVWRRAVIAVLLCCTAVLMAVSRTLQLRQRDDAVPVAIDHFAAVPGSRRQHTNTEQHGHQKYLRRRLRTAANW